MLFVVLICFLFVAFSAASNGDNTLITRFPFIMSHDAATGELNPARDYIIADWAKTQSVGLVNQVIRVIIC